MPRHRHPDRDLAHRRPALLPFLLVATLVVSGCGSAGSDVGTGMPRPESPATLDPVSRTVIKGAADRVATSPESNAYWMGYGDVCLMNLWPEEAIVAYRHVLDSPKPLDPVLAAKIRWRLARALHETGDAAAAEAEAEAGAALAAIPDFADGWVTLAGWRLDRGELEAADQALAKATTAQPLRRAVVAVQVDIQQGRLDDARATVDALLARGIEDRTISRLAVAVGRAQGDESLVASHEGKAAESLQISDDSIIVELAPLARHEVADLLRCLAFRASLPPARALAQIGPIVKDRPQLPMVRVIEGDLLRRLGRPADAKDALDVVRASDPPDHEYWALDAAVSLELAKNGRAELLASARASSDRAIEINPTIAYGWQIRALIDEQEGAWSKAAESYRKAAEHAERPEDAEKWLGDAMRCDAEAVQP